jgi:tetratricopeptide (TPR) repeat protein
VSKPFTSSVKCCRVPANEAGPASQRIQSSVFVDQGKAQERVPLLKEAVETFAKPTVADYCLGRGLADLSLYPEAVDHLEKAAAAAPESEVALHAFYKLSQVYHKLQRPADARNALAQFQKLQEQKKRSKVCENLRIGKR